MTTGAAPAHSPAPLTAGGTTIAGTHPRRRCMIRGGGSRVSGSGAADAVPAQPESPDPRGLRSVSVQPFKLLVAALMSAGVDVLDLLKDVGLSPEVMLEADARTSQATAMNLWSRAAERTGDPDIGLRALDTLSRDVLGLIRLEPRYLLLQSVVASRTVGEGLRRFVRYAPLSFGATSLRLQCDEAVARVTLVTEPDDALPRAFVQYLLGLPVVCLRLATDARLVPSAVGFAYHADLASSDRHRRSFGAPVTFGETTAYCEFRVADLAIPVTTHERAAYVTVTERAEAALRSLGAATAFADAVRQAISGMLADGIPSQADVARAMGLGPRTAARRLADEGLTFTEVRDLVLAARARTYLTEHAELSIAEVGERLGYGDPSAFHRAVRRWFGVSPRDLRLGRG
ncbi:MAG: AraC family transcriptional regulator ligand-binding domain-containing protein [Polyangiales bacterium]